jgi:L-ribulose-5-phosphate 3-epimerase
LSIPACIEKAAAMGFDGVEILHVQMQEESNAALQNIKRRAHSLGLALMGFSTHQGFVSPDPGVRQDNVRKTLAQIEVAYRLGIPTMRINTGRWGTIASFDDLMVKKGIEPPLAEHTEEEAFGWVIGSIEALLPRAEECGVVLGLENHWGLGRTAEGLLRIVEAIRSPWLGMTLDTGNFLQRSHEQIAQMLGYKVPIVLVQAKTYFGGGRWYTLDVDYGRIAGMLREHGYRGWISLEFEGNDDPKVAVPTSLALLRKYFS